MTTNDAIDPTSGKKALDFIAAAFLPPCALSNGGYDGAAAKSMVQKKKNYFFIKYFYRWETIGACLAMGLVTLWFYFRALTGICRYPGWFPYLFFSINAACLAAATFFIRRPGKPEAKMRVHSIAMFILLVVNPALAIVLADTFISVLWALHIAAYLLYCLLFVRFRKADRLVAGLPFAAFVLHVVARLFAGRPLGDAWLLAFFAFFMSLFYGLFYLFFQYTLDNARESLSVCLDNADVDRFLRGYRLTAREREICACLVNGYSARKAGEKLFISTGTVKNHTKNIYRKIGIKSRMELMHLIWDFTLLRRPAKGVARHSPDRRREGSS
jgi:DNA-binding CsgD family transcriptional regulator